MARRARRPAVRWPAWRSGLLISGPFVGGALLSIFFELLTGSFSLAALNFFLGAAVALAAVAMLLYRPRDTFLPAAIADAETQARLTRAQSQEAFERMSEAKERLERLTEQRRARMASGRVQRAALLQRPWKQMKGVEWEDFVVEVCRTLGGKVERRGQDEGGSRLVVEVDSRQVVVVAKTSDEALHSGAVQQAISAMHQERCEACALITNSRVTGAAQDFAARNGCRLIGRDEFPDFVLGQVGWE
jgi:hypothetical protein